MRLTRTSLQVCSYRIKQGGHSRASQSLFFCLNVPRHITEVSLLIKSPVIRLTFRCKTPTRIERLLESQDAIPVLFQLRISHAGYLLDESPNRTSISCKRLVGPISHHLGHP